MGAENLEGLKDLRGLNTSESGEAAIRARFAVVLGAENLEGLKDLRGLNTSESGKAAIRAGYRCGGQAAKLLL